MTLQDAEKYFKARLAEIDKLNETGTLSAYACYAWIIGVLSHLAYVAQTPTQVGVDYSRDRDCFIAFVRKYLSEYPAEVMYENFRCGLIHACSLDVKWKGDEKAEVPTRASKLFLTHDKNYHCEDKLKAIQLNGSYAHVIYYQDLSEDISSAIEQMFNDDEAKASIEKALEHQRLVEPLDKNVPQISRKFKYAETQFAQLSGFANSTDC